MLKHKVTFVLDSILFVFFSYILYENGLSLFSLPVIGLTIGCGILLILSYFNVKNRDIIEDTSLIKKLGFFGTLSIVWAIFNPIGTMPIIIAIVFSHIVRMPMLVLRTTTYMFVFFIIREIFLNNDEIQLAELQYDIFSTVLNHLFKTEQVLSLGLASACIIYMVYGIVVKRNLYIFIVGIVTCMTSIVYVLIFAVIYGIYTAIQYQMSMQLNNLKFTHPTVGSSREHYLVRLGPAQLKKIVINGFAGARDYFSDCLKSIPTYYKKKDGSIIFALYKTFFIIFSTTVNYIVRNLVVITIGIIHWIILYFLRGAYYLTLSFIRYRDANFRKKNAIKMVCGTCYHQSELPLYICPNCQVKHELVPNNFGIFMHRCACGTKLPNVYNKGRQELDAACPSCNEAYLEREIAPIIVPLIGSTQVGKTQFMLNGLNGLREIILPQNGYESEFGNEMMRQEFETLAQQNLVSPTPMSKRNPFILYLKSGSDKPNRALFSFDLSGRTYENYDMMKPLHFLSYADGYIFILDITSITSGDKIAIEDTIDRLLMYCQQEVSEKTEDKVKIPIAFIFNKVDQKQLPIMDFDAIKNWLNEQNLGHFVRKIDMSFSNYQFFMTSSIENPKNSNVAPAHVYEWIINQTNKGIKLKGGTQQHVEK